MTYHDLEGLALVVNLDATTAVGTIVPDLIRNTGGTVNTRRQIVSNEAASTVLPAVLLSAAVSVTVTGSQTGEDLGGALDGCGVDNRRGCGQKSDEVAAEHFDRSLC